MKRCRPALGTFVEVRVIGAGGTADAAVAEYAVELAFKAIREVEAAMSFHDPRSELTRLNRSAHRSPQAVTAATHEVLTAARDLHARTAGLFDCAVGDRLVGWGMLPDHHHDRGAWTDAPDPAATMADLELLADRVVSYRRPMRLDLGGIAKGYAVDRAIRALQRCGVDAAVVNAGGDLRVLGDREQAIHVRDPDDPGRLICIGALADGAIATSASYYSRRRVGGRMRSALLDPATRDAIVDTRSCSIVAPTCMIADGLTKVLAVRRRHASDRDPDMHELLGHYGAHAVVLER